MIRLLVRASLSAAMLWPAAAGRAAEPASDLGEVDFPTSGSPAAQEPFRRGVLLLHSFEYDDAAEEFRRAEKIAPDFAMAYWGEAMTANHPLWMERDRDAARAVLARLGPTPEARRAKAPTRREQMYLAAVEALYADGEKAERDRAYAETMRALHEEFPADLDAASFYALSLLGTCEGVRDFAVYMKAAAIVEEVFAKNPRHPGAAHYLVHCYDDPIHAPLGMRAARAYAKIAPAAGHALHMPSHIFLASGLWDDVAASNEAAWQASLERADRKKLSADAHNYHAILWLEYAYLQQGRYADARKTIETMARDAVATGSSRAKSHLDSMRAAYAVETGSRDAPPGASAPEGVLAFADGYLAFARGDAAGVETARRVLGGEGGGAATHGGGMAHGREAASRILTMELRAMSAALAGRRDEGIALAKEAAASEDATAYEFGPPDVVKPTHELAGELLLAADRPADARREFEASLARAPRRAQSLLGLARAAAKAGDAAASREAYADLARVWSRADSASQRRGDSPGDPPWDSSRPAPEERVQGPSAR